ncbi:MAG: DNA translocase FtsK [Acidimicrobiales bacterium]
MTATRGRGARRPPAAPKASTRAPRTGAPKGATAAPRPRSTSTQSTTTRSTTARRPSLGGAASGLVRATEGHRVDLAGVIVVGLGLLCALGVYLDGAGLVGRWAATAASTFVGAARIFVPPALVAAGVLLIRGRRGSRRSEPAEVGPAPPDPMVGFRAARSSPGSSMLAPITGGVVLCLAGLGLLHLGRGAPAFAEGGSALRDGAGAVGAAVGEPLQAGLATVGAAFVLVMALLGGLLLVSRTSLPTALRITAAGLGPAVATLGRAIGSLFHVGSEGGPPADDTPDPPSASPRIYDQDSDRSLATELGPEPRTAPLPEPDVAPEQLEIALGPAGQPSVWKLPPAKLLAHTGAQAVDRSAVEETGRGLEHALAEHGVETRLVGMTVGPTVTRYELELGPGVKVARVTSLHKDIAYAMATPDVRILAPIPGKQAIGVEIPNARKQLVTVGDILVSEEARRAVHPLEVAVGRDIAGKSVLTNLATMPHVLIAGATGAGKSSCINSLITSILMRSTPDQVRMILVDPKRVELVQYNRLPHLLTEVVTNPKKAANALAWAVREMERRYDLLSEAGFRDLNGYNAAFDRGELAPEKTDGHQYVRLPFILIIVDELNDLMMVAARDVEDSITRIAQMARAVGIHLVVATQRPSVNVITGVIKANIPARWAFAVSSLADSRVILDQPGAERLLGRGDMLLLGPASSIPKRIQAAWVTEDEVRKVAAHWIRQAPEVSYDEHVQGSEAGPGSGAGAGGGSGDEDDEELVAQAMELIVRSQLGSTSMLQRKLRVGFARAGRLMDLLEQRGVVGPSEGSKARAVLMTVEELDASSTP